VLQHFLYFSQNRQQTSELLPGVNSECPACYCSSAKQYLYSRMGRASSKWRFRQQAVVTKTQMDSSSLPPTQPRLFCLKFPPIWRPQRRHPLEKVLECWQDHWRGEEVAASRKLKLNKYGTFALVSSWRKDFETDKNYVDKWGMPYVHKVMAPISSN
jgi:hypothetical protein